MNKNKTATGGLSELRRRAEAQLRTAKTKGCPARTEADAQRLVHELQVHQIELEMQNTELVQARAELEAALWEYTDLYDFAPVGYFSLGRDGAIRRVNLTGALLLGVERARLTGRWFGTFVGMPDRSVFSAFLEEVFAGQAPEVCEVAIRGEGKGPLAVHITATVSQGGSECRLMMADVSKLRQAEKALRQSESLLARSQEIAHVGSWMFDVVAHRLTWSDEVYRIFGLKPQEFSPTYEAFFESVHPDDRAAVDAAYTGSIREGKGTHEIDHRIVHKHTGEVRWVREKCIHERNDSGQIVRSIGMVQDITDRKQAELERETTVKFLEKVNSCRTTGQLIETAITFFQHQSGCEAVGIRLAQGEDFPYYEVRGFPAAFEKAESRLCSRDPNGAILRDDVGNPVLECMCGNVIQGRFDASKPFFSEKGSFWTNSTTELLASTSEADRQARTRNRCHGEGYESVALVPLWLGAERLGLLQLNDRRRGLFTAELVALWERMAGYLSVALAKLRTEEKLRTSELNLKTLFDAIDQSVFLFDRDGTVLAANRTFAARLGKRVEDCVGRSAFDLVPPGIAAGRRAISQKVIDTGRPQVFEDQRDGRWMNHNFWPVLGAAGAVERLVVFAMDITERKLAEETLEHSRQMLQGYAAYLQETIENERLRMARELHDDIGQRLSALKMDLGWVKRRLPPDRSDAARKLEEMSELITEGVQTVKAICADLRPGLLEELGLQAALEWAVARFQERSGITTSLKVGGSQLNVDAGMSIAIYRIVQEALTNIVRHAAAGRAEVRLRRELNWLILEVEDDGRGLPGHPQGAPQSFGIIGMRERVRSFGGEFNLSAGKERGAVIRARFPLPPSETSAELH